MCEEHRDHWRIRGWAILASDLAIVGSVVTVAGLMFLFFWWQSDAGPPVAFIMTALASLLAASLAGRFLLDHSGIRSAETEVTEAGLRLERVSAKFIAAYERRHSVVMPDLDDAASQGWGGAGSQMPPGDEQRFRPAEPGYPGGGEPQA